MAQGRGAEELATPRSSSGREEQQPGETGGTRGGGGGRVLIQLSTDAETKW